eukprot:GAFH01001446.1.p1 GENE.GAFH01001446.1~~GAFH01001446.1.p1  ORF type:complete len:500 (+),score=205.90 GAFH01001446.1:113-1612(+)
MMRLRRHRYDDSLKILSDLLAKNPYDQSAWYLKLLANIQKQYIDDTELEEEGIGDQLLDRHTTSDTPRPSTSFARPLTSRPGTGSAPGTARPMTSTGRPLTGFQRPSTSTRPITAVRGAGALERVLTAMAPGTARPATSSGRLVRLGTASLASSAPGAMIDTSRLDLAKYAARPGLAKILCDYILYVEHNPRLAFQLAALATEKAEYKDWWWKARIGRCEYQLGMLDDATKQFKSALKIQDMASVYLELAKVYWRTDQPNTALECYTRGCEGCPGDIQLLLGIAHVHDAINDIPKAEIAYKKVLLQDSSNVEAIACLGAHHFYADQPEIAIRFFRRLLQMGLNSPELWNNLALCCFYSGQYDMVLSCFERALNMAEDDCMADVWYNIGIFAVGISDLGLAYQAFKIAVSLNSAHAEAFTNLGVLEMRRGNTDHARSNFRTAMRLTEHMFEPYYNGALLAFKVGEFQESFKLVEKALQIDPLHPDSQELKKQLQQLFSNL